MIFLTNYLNIHLNRYNHKLSNYLSLFQTYQLIFLATNFSVEASLLLLFFCTYLRGLRSFIRLT